MLDAVIDYLPSPTEVPAIQGVIPRWGNRRTGKQTMKHPLSALAFKIMADPYGRLTFVRVYSGSFEKRQLRPEFNQK